METPPGPRLIEFIGHECIHCARMGPVVEAAERNIGQRIEKREVWHDEENARLMEETYGDTLRAACGGYIGIPAFVNEATDEALCGEQELETLLAWARGTSRRPLSPPSS